MRGEADNVGDGVLFGGERHGHAAPFAGRVGLDPGAWLISVSFCERLTTIVRDQPHRSDADVAVRIAQ